MKQLVGFAFSCVFWRGRRKKRGMAGDGYGSGREVQTDSQDRTGQVGTQAVVSGQWAVGSGETGRGGAKPTAAFCWSGPAAARRASPRAEAQRRSRRMGARRRRIQRPRHRALIGPLPGALSRGGSRGRPGVGRQCGNFGAGLRDSAHHSAACVPASQASQGGRQPPPPPPCRPPRLISVHASMIRAAAPGPNVNGRVQGVTARDSHHKLARLGTLPYRCAHASPRPTPGAHRALTECA